MHKNIVWFDTTACWKSKFIGDINSVTISPATNTRQLEADPTKKYNTTAPATDASLLFDLKHDRGRTFEEPWMGWYTGGNYANTSPVKNWNK